MFPRSVSRFFSYTSGMRFRAGGQSIVEYAGMIVISTLMVGGMMGGAKQLMPVLFSLLSDRNAMALSDEPPMPAASFSSPSPAGSMSPAVHEATTGALLSPKVETMEPNSALKLQISLPLALTQSQPAQPQAAPSSAGSVTVKSMEPKEAAGPTPAPAPAMYGGPSPAPSPRMAPGPAPAPAPKMAPSLTPVSPP